jgi:hypothetical protein
MASIESKIKAYAGPQEAVASIQAKLSKKPLLEFATNYVTKLYEQGFYAVADRYIQGNNRIIMNRSKGAESNFFSILEVNSLSSGCSVYFSDPNTGEEALKSSGNIVYKYGGGILRAIFGGYDNPSKGTEIANKTLEFASTKKENEYRCYLHSHLGYVNVNGDNQALWGDGRTQDKNWILHTMLAHGDVHALTEHNWTQNEERLNALKEHCDAANITFIPGWENTTTVVYPSTSAEDLVKAPHILCFCANINVAMQMKQEFLIKKLKQDVPITPIFCGVPAPFDEHIAFMKKYHDQGILGIVIAHPFSTLPGIDLCDPENVGKLGVKKIKSIFEFADGVEMHNGAETHGQLNLEISSEKEGFKQGFKDWLIGELLKHGSSSYLSAPNLNWLMGKMADENGKSTTYGQDDHQLFDIGPGYISTYNQGHTKMLIPEQKFQKLKEESRKLDSEEFVKAMILKKFESTVEPVELKAFAFANMTDKGPEIVEERRKTTLGNIVEKVRSVPYYTNVGKLTLQYWYATHIIKNEKQIAEIAKELEKAKSYNLKPSKSKEKKSKTN